MSIENNLAKLETIAQELENQDINLDDSLKKYTHAIKLANLTSQKIQKIENQILILDQEMKKI